MTTVAGPELNGLRSPLTSYRPSQPVTANQFSVIATRGRSRQRYAWSSRMIRIRFGLQGQAGSIAPASNRYITDPGGPMNCTSREPTVLTITCGWPSCPRGRHRTAAASVHAPGPRD